MRATGLQGEAPPEIIEIIDDDTDAFGDRAPNATIYDTGGPRWVGPVAAAALVGLIGYGIATSASTSSTPKVAAPSSTIPSPTTTRPPAPTTTLPPGPVVPYYAVEPPIQYSVEFAETMDGRDDGGPANTSHYQLWATPDATATSGSWFSIEAYIGGNQALFAQDAFRVETTEGPVALSRTSTGQSVAQVVSNRTVLTVTSFGFTDQELVRLAGAIDVNRSRGGDNGEVVISDLSAVGDLRMLTTVSPWFALQGEPAAVVSYADGNNPMGNIQITVAPRPRSNEGGGTLDRQTALRFFLAHSTPFDVDGHVAVAGSVIRETDYSVATWIARDHIVTVSAMMPVAELVALARTVHVVSEDEWNGMQFQAARHNADNDFGSYEETDPIAVSFGTDANAESWVVRAGISTFDDIVQVTWLWDGFGFSTQTHEAATINTVVDSKRTYVLADLPRGIAPSPHLQVTREGFEPVEVPFSDTDASFDRTFAAYAFSEATQYTAQVVAADGAVLASWPSG